MNAVNIKFFFKTGTQKEVCELWKTVFKNTKRGEYICTHGYSVPWLHVRITKNIPSFYSKKLENQFDLIENKFRIITKFTV